MSDKLRIFLAHSFATQPVNALGEEDRNSRSDMQIADLVAGWLNEFSRGQFEIVRTHDPHRNYIPSQVRRDICSSDLFLCLFTKRTRDNLKNLWLPSTYVISEASAALMQLPSEDETHARLFGLREEDVDPEQLGMAFPRTKAVESFRRDDLEGLRAKVKAIVDHVLGVNVSSRDDREYLSIDKVVSVWRNGSVVVECRHRFRFTAACSTVRIPHAMWRISSPLPELPDLLSRRDSMRSQFLRCVPLDCGNRGQRACHLRIHPRASIDPQERNFEVEFTGLSIEPGDELSYEIAWAYPKAFRDPTKLGGVPNSVGLRTGDRGMAHQASLTLRFQRDLDDVDGEHDLILEDHPQVSIIGTPLLPAGRDRIEFWHRAREWKHVDQLQPCRKRCGAIFEAYHWKRECFNGMAKVTWTPYFNYFQEDPDVTLATDPTTNAEHGFTGR